MFHARAICVSSRSFFRRTLNSQNHRNIFSGDSQDLKNYEIFFWGTLFLARGGGGNSGVCPGSSARSENFKPAFLAIVIINQSRLTMLVALVCFFFFKKLNKKRQRKRQDCYLLPCFLWWCNSSKPHFDFLQFFQKFCAKIESDSC